MAHGTAWIRVRGAREHNLHNVDVDLPRDRMTVLTGPSGSGKSSLAFDTLYAEGQRRYLETLRGDTRALFDQLRRPDVDLIDGLPPTLCVSQQTVAARPRSTLATLTEIHDHLRLLWARLGTPHCPRCGAPIRRQTPQQIAQDILTTDAGRKVLLLAPLVRGEKGEHREAFQYIRQNGFLRARVNGVLTEVRDVPRINPRQTHTIDLVVDRLLVREGIEDRLAESLASAARHGGGRVVVAQAEGEDWDDRAYSTRYACPRCDVTVPDLAPRSFSFNNPAGACPTCDGLGRAREIDPAQVVPDTSWPAARIVERLHEQTGGVVKLPSLDRKTLKTLGDAFPHPGGKKWGAATPLRDWPAGAAEAFLHGSEQTIPPFPGLIYGLNQALREAEEDDGDEAVREALGELMGEVTCPECGGARLNEAARAVRFAGRGIHEVTALTVEEAVSWFAGPGSDSRGGGEVSLPGAAQVRRVLVEEILHRLRFLVEVGLGYLTLDRPAPTLSGGEAQRARLATHLGAGLLGVCYILDEPTVGLHPRDTERLLRALRGLRERGNTLVVVEHDEAVIRAADYLVDVGPGAGRDGGRVLASGSVEEVLGHPDSVTGAALSAPSSRGPARELQSHPSLVIRGARHHNLKNITVTLPTAALVCVTGVSGSGKSSLVHDVLGRAVRRHLGLVAPPPGAHDGVEGLDHIDRLIEVSQAALGRSPRSSAATYTGLFDEIRKVFAATREARARGYTASRFSFNVKGGRCEECQGQGSRKVALDFLPDLTAPCPACRGQRFNPATLEVRFRGLSIADVLALSVDEALATFSAIPSVARPLQALADVGLGYLALGQPSSTLSGGEAQRVKLAGELARSATGRTLFIFDEPTTGLHLTDVRRLLGVLRRLVEAGNSLVVIEHNLELIAAADWVIDLGPEGGAGGGHLLAEGSPSHIADLDKSITGKFLAGA